MAEYLAPLVEAIIEDEYGMAMNGRDDVNELAASTWLAGRYQIAGLRARGALSLVYQGQDAVLQRAVIIKSPLPEFIPAYRETLELSASLAHPAFLTLYDVVEQDNRLFLAYEFVDGRPLNDYIATGLPVRRAVALMLQIARALAYAHAHGVTHGDLTPAAILVDRSAVARISNLGLPPDGGYFDDIAASAFNSSIADDPDATAAVVLDQNQEQFDVWAAAALLWTLVTDITPEAPDADAVAPTQRARAFRVDSPPPLRQVVERTLRVSHPQTLTTAADLAHELDTIQHALEEASGADEHVLPERIAALRARNARANGMASAGGPGARKHDTGVRAAANAVTDYDSREPNYAYYAPDVIQHDPHQTNPSEDRARTDDYVGGDAYAAQAPRLTLPARQPQRWPGDFSSSSPTIPERDLPPYQRRTAQGGLGIWVWALISVAIFALCFGAGFFLAPVLPFHLP